MDKAFKAFLILTALALLALSAVFGYRAFSGLSSAPDFYASILRVHADGTQETGTYGFSKRDFESGRPFDFDSKKTPGFPEDFFAQGFCSSGSETYVAGGRTGLSPDSAKIFRIVPGEGQESGGAAASPFMEGSEYRYRSCAFGNVSGRIFWAVTHGSGTLVIKGDGGGGGYAYKLPSEFSDSGSGGILLSHFLAFADLDDDGTDEAYLTATTPFLNSGGVMKEYGTVFRYSFTWGLGSGTVSDVGLPQPASARRLKATEFFGKKELLVLYEHVANDSSPSPKLFRFSFANGSPVPTPAFEFSGHRECKTLSESAILPYPTIQVGCDHATLYVLKKSGDSLVLDRKTVFGNLQIAASAEYRPWGNYAIHSILAGDWNSDGRPDVAVAVNNDGIYLSDFSMSDPIVWKIAFPKEGDSSDDPYMVVDMTAAPTSR